MAILPENLIKQFAKATNDTKDEKKENFLYGTARIIDGNIEVLIDGADIYTPCTSSVTVETGDRVVVMIKNRQAVITSNVSNPTITTGYLEAGEAVISGTIHAARYEDSTGNFTMDIGSVKPPGDSALSPAFSIGGYFNGDPNEKYAKLEIYFEPPWDGATDYDAIPTMWIEGSIRDNPDDIYDSHVNVGIGQFGIQFNGSHNTIESGRRVIYKLWTNLPWQNAQRQEQ